MLLAIDIGNTRIKAAVFEESTLLELFVFDASAAQSTLNSILKKFSNIENAVAASVGNLKFELPSHVKLYMIDSNWPMPFRNCYATPETLGADRIVLAAGATLQFPAANRLVIDAGTCVTYDFIDDEDNYHGGAISPGLLLRYRALNHYTARLPLLDRENPAHYIGNSTNASIHSGVVNGLTAEIDGFIERYRADYPNFIIILTGGDSEFLAERLKNTIFAHSNFLLESLNRIFHYKINK